MMPSGTLTRKMARQPVPSRSASTSAPPMIGAATADRPITGPNNAKAFVTSCSSKTSLIIPKPCGIRTAPNAPWSARVAISIPGDTASALSTDAAVKPAIPIMKRRRRPTRSPSRAPATSRTANVRV